MSRNPWDGPWLYPLLAVSEIALVVKALAENGEHGSYAVLMFKSPFTPAGEDPVINLQYSIEDGVLGFDWVLLADRNIADEQRARCFIEQAGHRVHDREMNEVYFLRVEDGDLAALAGRLCTEVYALRPESEVSLHVAGFDYVPDDAIKNTERARTTRYFVFNKGSALPARQVDYYSTPEVWLNGAWTACEALEDWRIYALPISEVDFDALCVQCKLTPDAGSI